MRSVHLPKIIWMLEELFKVWNISMTERASYLIGDGLIYEVKVKPIVEGALSGLRISIPCNSYTGVDGLRAQTSDSPEARNQLIRLFELLHEHVPACYWESVLMRVFTTNHIDRWFELVLTSPSESRILVIRPIVALPFSGDTKIYTWAELRAIFDRNKESLAIDTKQVQ